MNTAVPRRRTPRVLLAITLLTTMALGVTANVGAGAQEPAERVGTGRAVAVAGVLPVLGPIAVADTGAQQGVGPFQTEESLAFLPGSLLTLAGAHSQVSFRSDAGSLGSSDVTALILGIPGLPVIRLWGVASWSATTCEGSGGTASVALLQIGGRRVNVATSPNTTIPLGIATIVINEQRRFTTADGGSGLTVTGVHIFSRLLGINLFLASSTSDIHGCPGTTPIPQGGGTVGVTGIKVF